MNGLQLQIKLISWKQNFVPPSNTILRQLLKGLMHRFNLGKKKKGKEKQMDFLFVTADQAISILPSSQVFVTRVIKKKGKEGSDSEVRVLPLEKKKKKNTSRISSESIREQYPSSQLQFCLVPLYFLLSSWCNQPSEELPQLSSRRYGCQRFTNSYIAECIVVMLQMRIHNFFLRARRCQTFYNLVISIPGKYSRFTLNTSNGQKLLLSQPCHQNQTILFPHLLLTQAYNVILYSINMEIKRINCQTAKEVLDSYQRYRIIVSCNDIRVTNHTRNGMLKECHLLTHMFSLIACMR